MLSCSVFYSAFVTNVAIIIVAKLALFTNPAIADLSTFFYFIFASVVWLVNLL